MEKRPMKPEDAKKKCGQQLKKLSRHITPDDRRGAMAQYNISYVTVSRYLQGNAANLVLGINLLNYFTNALNNRGKQLNDLLN